jgi:transposase
VHLDLAYRWFFHFILEGSVSNPSAISKNRRSRFRACDLFRHLFEAAVRRCLDEGLVSGKGFAVDAGLIRAHANKQAAWQEPTG